MSDRQIDHMDYDELRARVEQRLKPRLRLIRRRWWLIIHIIVFLTAMAFIYGGDHKPLFYYSVSQIIPASSYPDPTGVSVSIPEYTFESWYIYGSVSLLSIVWFVALIVQILHTWIAFGRERLIQRAMDKEIEIERLRLQVELARLNGNVPTSNSDTSSEKPKRAARLSDDGELVYEPPIYNSNFKHS